MWIDDCADIGEFCFLAADNGEIATACSPGSAARDTLDTLSFVWRCSSPPLRYASVSRSLLDMQRVSFVI